MKKANMPILYIRPDKVKALFLLCWLAYFASYIGRLNYSAVMAEIIASEGITNASAGMVGTGFFICYGAGQLVSGYLGDKIPPKWMVFLGLALSSVANLVMSGLKNPGAMLVVWCFNGAIQAMLWTPILRVIAEYFPPAYRKKACVNITLTYPVAMFTMYLLSAALVAFFGWRWVFRVSFLLVAGVALIWLMRFSVLEGFRDVVPEEVAVAKEGGPQGKQGALRFPLLLLVIMCVALVAQGALRDGVINWVPAYLSESFGIGTALAILTSTLLPVINLAGVYAAGWLYKKNKNEVLTALQFFLLSAGAALVLYLAGSVSVALSVLSFSLLTAGMMGVNLMLVSFVPTYFARFGRVSLVAGLLNSSVYIGSSVAVYGIGAVADALGWNMLLVLLLVTALVGATLCALLITKWMKFKQLNK